MTQLRTPLGASPQANLHRVPFAANIACQRVVIGLEFLDGHVFAGVAIPFGDIVDDGDFRLLLMRSARRFVPPAAAGWVGASKAQCGIN